MSPTETDFETKSDVRPILGAAKQIGFRIHSGAISQLPAMLLEPEEFVNMKRRHLPREESGSL
jgi:hypothetical protein